MKDFKRVDYDHFSRKARVQLSHKQHNLVEAAVRLVEASYPDALQVAVLWGAKEIVTMRKEQDVWRAVTPATKFEQLKFITVKDA